MTTTELVLHQVDAFTDRPFAGNPAAVCLLDRERDDGWLRNVAAEMNLSETAFALRRDDGDWQLRWFTPKVEVDLCGHATLATAHVLWHECGEESECLRFHTRSGVLTATHDADSIRLAFPARPEQAIGDDFDLVALRAALGAEPAYVGRSRDDLLVVLERAGELRQLEPDLQRLLAIDVRGVIVTAASDDPDHDFVSRFFAPRVGVPEDPVTGSAHCVLAPYWGARLGKTAMRGHQISARGGVIGVRLTDEGVELAGQAVTVLRGKLHA
ncbi:MAG: PhzF family phenazine biosynthesis protein [Chromatiales bacterium]|jgi:PhzF family phenazine biosynthesis protein|nr:PhzF family phenazine biosynthesis protein [Chromatiales bacterium]MDX9766988.1 PhzF family phenazine biosynthesis protein [Ectothiorhodospiraceae bacterium]